MGLTLTPLTQREARAFIAAHHRHNLAPRGDIIRVGLTTPAGELVAVATAGRPTARALDDGRTIEITRVATQGHENACSRLYGALCRAAKALGYTTAITYTLAGEPGTSPKAAGFTEDATLAARATWDTPAAGRHRYQTDLFGEQRRPPEAKTRWRRAL